MGTGEGLERLFLHWLTRMEGMGAVTVKRIGAFAGSYRNAYYIEGMELQKAGILKTEESCIRYDAWKKESVLSRIWIRIIRHVFFHCMTFRLLCM